MSTATLNVSEYDVIADVVQHYIDGAKSGRGDDMKPAFHKDATIFGYAGAELFASIDLIDTVATVRLELDNWTGHRFTDLFTLLKVDGEWKIMNKVFHLTPEGVAPFFA